MFDIYII